MMRGMLWLLLRIPRWVRWVAAKMWCYLVVWHRYAPDVKATSADYRVCECRKCVRCGAESGCFWHARHSYY